MSAIATALQLVSEIATVALTAARSGQEAEAAAEAALRDALAALRGERSGVDKAMAATDARLAELERREEDRLAAFAKATADDPYEEVEAKQ